MISQIQSIEQGPAPPEVLLKTTRWKMVGICAVLAAAVWLVFGQTLRHDFVKYDDEDYVTDNPMVQGGLNVKSVAWAFTTRHASNWHPITWISHMLDCQLYGLTPAGHHLTNVLLHGATSILLFLVMYQMTRPCGSPTGIRAGAANRIPFSHDLRLWGSAFIAAVFAVHPLRVESVAWVAERKDVLSGLFFMLTLWSYVRYAQKTANRVRGSESAPVATEDRRSPPRGYSFVHYLLALLFFALGLMSKPMLVTVPFVLLLLDAWPLERLNRFTLPRLLIEKVPFLVLAIGACAMTLLAQEKLLSEQTLSLRAGNALISYALYLMQLICPVQLSVLYPLPGGSLPFWRIAVALVVLAGISVLAITSWRSRPWLLIGWLWYLGMLVPVIGLLQVGVQAHADRYTYLPQIGLCFMLTWTAITWCAGRHQRGLVLRSFGAIALAALMICARTQTSFWRNSESLWTHTLACVPDSIVAHINFGNVLLQRGRADDAIAHYQTALQLNPGVPDAHVGLGYALVQEGQLDDAVRHFEEALQIKPDQTEVHYILGYILSQQGKVQDAISHFQSALQLEPGHAQAHFELGNARLQQGNLAGAIAQFEKAIEFKPDYPDALNNLAWALATAPEASRRNGNRAVELARRANGLTGDKDPDILGTLAAAYAEAGLFQDARQTAAKAIELARGHGQPDQLAQLNHELELYASGHPFHLEGK